MICNAAFKKEILQICYEELTLVGFVRFRKWDIDLPLDEMFNCWVGLNTGLYQTHVQISPFVGIHAVEIERMCAALSGNAGDKYNRAIATYPVHMGELEPAEQVFQFSTETDNRAAARRLAQLYATSGLQFAKSIVSYDALLPLLESRVKMLGGYPQRVTSCLYLMGRGEEALSFARTLAAERPEYFGTLPEGLLREISH
jgi:hypothetical protein